MEHRDAWRGTWDAPSVLTAQERVTLARLWLLEARGLTDEERATVRVLERAIRTGSRPDWHDSPVVPA